MKQCTSEWISDNGVRGRKFTGPNGTSIFLPAAGDRNNWGASDFGPRGYYWSSTLNESGNACAWFSISIVIILLRITETFIYTMEGQYEPFTRTEGELLPSKKESLLQPQKGRLSKIIPTSLVGDGMIFVIGAFFL